MSLMQYLVEKLEALLTGGAMVALLLGAGIFFTLRSGFYQIRGVPFILRNTVATLFRKPERSDGISPFQAVSTALAGTMGVGNIAGVATALVAGGPGAIFWMWVGAFFGMMTKYAEIFLAVRHRRTAADGSRMGGPMYYMEDAVGGRLLPGAFAVLCAACSLGIGNMTQSNSVAVAAGGAFAIPQWITGLVSAVIVAMVVFGGVKRIAAVTEIVIPIASILYLCCAGAFLYIHRAMIPTAFETILSGAFSPRTAAGAIGGYGVSRAISMGLARGVFTNEAGLGSAPIAHASADCKSPAHQGAWGVFEVFLDTIIVCTLTALVILVADGGNLLNSGLDGAALTSAAFAGAFGRFGDYFIAVSIAFFAISAMLGWCFYGESALGYLTGGNSVAIHLYRFAFICCIVLGAVAELTAVWRLSDCLNTLMAVPNIIALFLLRGEILVLKR